MLRASGEINCRDAAAALRKRQSITRGVRKVAYWGTVASLMVACGKSETSNKPSSAGDSSVSSQTGGAQPSGGSTPSASSGGHSSAPAGGTSTGGVSAGSGEASGTGSRNTGGSAAGGTDRSGGAASGEAGADGTGASSAGGGNPASLPSAECQSHLLEDSSAPCPDPSVNLSPAQLYIGHNSNLYQGQLPRCDAFSPSGDGFRFRFRVDDITEGDYDIFDAAYLNGANVDVDPPCGHSLHLAGFGLTHNIVVGDVLIVSQRITQGQKDHEVRGTHAIASEQGELLAAEVTTAAPGFVDTDLLQGLELLYGSADICVPIPDVYALGTLGLRAPGEDMGCLVDSDTRVDCCRLWGHEYTIATDSVIIGEDRYAPIQDAPYTSFSLYRNDFIQLCTGQQELPPECEVHASRR